MTFIFLSIGLIVGVAVGVYIGKRWSINRLKEENEGLTAELEVERKNFSILMNLYKQAKFEAYKEFAERVKEEAVKTYYGELVFTEDDVDNILKEMGCGE